MRENIKSMGMIIALIVACVSLPIGIMGFNKESIINNYYDNYYTTINNTTIINNNTTIFNNNTTYTPEPEPDYSLPLETSTYYNLTGNPEWYHHRVYNATSEYVLIWYINQTEIRQQRFYIILDPLFDLWDDDKINSAKQYDDKSLGSSLLMRYYYTFPFSGTWHIIFRYDHPGGLGINITIRSIINKI